MILLNIVKATKFTPLKVSDEQKAGKVVLSFSGGEGSPQGLENGTVEFLVSIIQGEFEGVHQVVFLHEVPIGGVIVNCTQCAKKEYIVEIEFELLFLNGLEYSIRNYISNGGATLGLTKTEGNELNELSEQRNLLSFIADCIIPSRKNDIIELAKPSVVLFPYDGSDREKPHFFGPSKLVSNFHPATKEGEELFHLSTFEIGGLPQEFERLQNYLSFFIKKIGPEDEWPEEKDEFRVMNMDELATDYRKKVDIEAKEVNFTSKLFLDIPSYNDSILDLLAFSDEERERFDVFSSVFKRIVLGVDHDQEVSKLFGYPQSVQDCVLYGAEMEFSNRGYGPEITRDAVKWVLLFQFAPFVYDFENTFDDIDGIIFFLIKKDDLIKGRFDDVQMILQGT